MRMLAAWAIAAVLHGPLSFASRVLAHGAPSRAAPLVVVDPGHGGKDGGARHGGVNEDEINLAAGRALAAALRADGYRVLMTREEGCDGALYSGSSRKRPLDLSPVTVRRPGGCRLNLRDRVLRAAANGESAFISLHCDHYADPSVHGPRTYYAEDIQSRLDTLRERPWEASPAQHFVLVTQPNVPAATVELGFLTNPKERRLLQQPTYRKELAAAIAQGVVAFAKGHPLLPPPQVDRSAVESRWRMTHPNS
jgi:N-acetylmuramoyl-L-alanine amidase